MIWLYSCHEHIVHPSIVCFLADDYCIQQFTSQPHTLSSSISSSLKPRPSPRTIDAGEDTQSRNQQRASSPSMSIRSLAQHLGPTGSSCRSQYPVALSASPLNPEMNTMSPKTPSPKKKSQIPETAPSSATSQRPGSAGHGTGESPTKTPSSRKRNTSNPIPPHLKQAQEGESTREGRRGSEIRGGERPGSSRSAQGQGQGQVGRRSSSLWNLFSVGGEYEL